MNDDALRPAGPNRDPMHGGPEVEQMPQGPSMPQLLSTGEVCRIFGRDARTIRRWTKNGHLRPIRIGSAVFFNAEEVAAVLRGKI